MLKFKNFLNEAVLAGSGSEGERHAGKYITPYIGKENTHTLKSTYGNIQAGIPITVHGHKIINGKHHAIVSHADGEQHAVPFTKVIKPKKEAEHTYNDEHATARVWNHGVKHNLLNDKPALLKHIEDAKKNPKHPLSFESANDEGFSGKVKTEKHRDSYYKELHAAAHGVHALAQHPDFHNAAKNGHVMRVMGSNRGTLSQLWQKHGAKGASATSKSDIALGPKGKEGRGLLLSMKKGGGSQLASPYSAETKALHDHATKDMLDNHPQYSKMSAQKKKSIHSSVMDRIGKLTEHMDAAKYTDREGKKEHVKKAQTILNDIHDEHPMLNHFLRKEAIIGRGKFGEGSEHSPTHLVTGATRNDSAKVQHVNNLDYNGPRPYIALGKKGSESDPLTMRLKT